MFVRSRLFPPIGVAIRLVLSCVGIESAVKILFVDGVSVRFELGSSDMMTPSVSEPVKVVAYAF